ncbi:MAG: hypothetical protein ACOC1F_12855, partial [Myxococcota bacterium]
MRLAAPQAAPAQLEPPGPQGPAATAVAIPSGAFETVEPPTREVTSNQRDPSMTLVPPLAHHRRRVSFVVPPGWGS